MLNRAPVPRSEIVPTAGNRSHLQVPGSMIGAGDHVTQKNAEQQGTEFLTFTLYPWLSLVEQEVNRKLFLNVRGQKRRVRFDVRSMRYPDAKSRTTLYNGGKNWGYLCTNDIAEMEGHNPIEQSWADDYWMPQGFAKCDDLPASMMGQKAKAAFEAKHPGATVPTSTAAQPDGVPGMSLPNGGRPEGVAENGRSALVVRADGTGYEQATIYEEPRRGDTRNTPDRWTVPRDEGCALAIHHAKEADCAESRRHLCRSGRRRVA